MKACTPKKPKSALIKGDIMCGIIAVDINDISSEQIEGIRRLLIETEVRGKHASGISWYSEGKVQTIKRPLPISELLEEFDIYRCVDDNNGRLSMIAHIRYSTSNLEFNQPITAPLLLDDQIHFDTMGNPGDFSIVHNGVITQSDPSLWNEEYGLGVAAGENDSELVFMALSEGKHPLKYFIDSSMAVCTINHLGHVRAFRNGKRPLWISRLYNGFIATSTKDVIERSKIEVNSIMKTEPGVDYNLTTDSNDIIVKDMEDLQ